VTTEGHRRGRKAEDAALQQLQAAGLRLVARNARSRGGEIDLIMRDGGTLVFVEVRSRRSRSHGGALASIDGRKQQRMVRAAQSWLALHPHEAGQPMRFDILAFEGEEAGHWLRNAIEASA
jgi:putative endonuclease